MAITREFLSGSTNGRGIKVAATATPGTTIHAAHATSEDEVYIYAFNSDASAVDLTIEWGGTTDPDDLIEVSIPSLQGLTLVIPGLVISGSLVVRAFAGTTNVLVITGFVNRITP